MKNITRILASEVWFWIFKFKFKCFKNFEMFWKISEYLESQNFPMFKRRNNFGWQWVPFFLQWKLLLGTFGDILSLFFNISVFTMWGSWFGACTQRKFKSVSVTLRGLQTYVLLHIAYSVKTFTSFEARAEIHQALQSQLLPCVHYYEKTGIWNLR